MAWPLEFIFFFMEYFGNFNLQYCTFFSIQSLVCSFLFEYFGRFLRWYSNYCGFVEEGCGAEKYVVERLK